MVRNIIVALLFGAYVSVSSLAQERQSAPPIPSTISPEAQAFLEDPPPPAVIPQTLDALEEWRAIQDEFEKNGLVQSKQVVDALQPNIVVRKMGGVDVHVITPRTFNPANGEKALIHIHGGGYCVYTSASSYFVCVTLADLTGLRVYCIDYRLAPQHPFPAGLNDCFAAYQEIIKEVEPKNLGMFGISAGGSMIVSMLLKARDGNVSMPGAVASVTPGADMSATGDTYDTLNGLDPVASKRISANFGRAYAGDEDLKHPLISPVYAEFSKHFPPTIIQSGTRDLLLSNSVRLYRKMKDSGVDVELSVWEGMWHGFHVFPSTTYPEARAAFREISRFFERRLRLDIAE